MASLHGEHSRYLADDVRVVLVGNKSDLSSEGKRAVTEREGRSRTPSSRCYALCVCLQAQRDGWTE
jgi:GTPase SAR1 family protein